MGEAGSSVCGTKAECLDMKYRACTWRIAGREWALQQGKRGSLITFRVSSSLSSNVDYSEC